MKFRHYPRSGCNHSGPAYTHFGLAEHEIHQRQWQYRVFIPRRPQYNRQLEEPLIKSEPDGPCAMEAVPPRDSGWVVSPKIKLRLRDHGPCSYCGKRIRAVNDLIQYVVERVMDLDGKIEQLQGPAALRLSEDGKPWSSTSRREPDRQVKAYLPCSIGADVVGPLTRRPFLYLKLCSHLQRFMISIQVNCKQQTLDF